MHTYAGVRVIKTRHNTLYQWRDLL